MLTDQFIDETGLLTDFENTEIERGKMEEERYGYIHPAIQVVTLNKREDIRRWRNVARAKRQKG